MNTAKQSRTNSWKRVTMVASAAAMMLATGCGGGGSSKPRVETRTLFGNVNGINNVPPVNTQVTGRVSVRVSDERSPMTFSLNINSFRTDFQTQNADITRVTVNAPAAATVYPPNTGPVLFMLYQKPTGASTPFPATFSRTVTAADFATAPGAPRTYAEAVRLVREGGALLQVFTQRYPNGEARGYIGQDRLGTFLGRGQIEPFPDVNTRGLARVDVNAALRRVFVSINIEGTQEVPDVQGIEIHFGLTRQEGVNAPVIFRLSGPVANAFPRSFSKTLTAKEFMPTSRPGARSFDEFLQSLPVLSFSGTGNQAFLNVRTRRFPNGELRGSIFQNNIRQPMLHSKAKPQ